MTVDRDTHLLSGAYALDALTPQEAQAVEAAMRDSEELRGEVVGLVDTAVALGLALPPAAPPPALRASLLAAVQDLPQLPAEQALEPSREREPDVERAASQPPAGAHRVPRRRRRLLRRPAVLLTAAGLAVLLFGGGVLVQRAMIEPQLEYSRISAAADVQHATVDVVGGGEAGVVWSRSEQATAVTVTGVEVPAGHVLQLWTVRGGVATSAGLYEPTSDAQYELLHRVPAVGEQLAVSVEPAGGSEQPTKVVASVALEA